MSEVLSYLALIGVFWVAPVLFAYLLVRNEEGRDE